MKVFTLFSRGIGWAFIACAAYIAIRPGGVLHREVVRWQETNRNSDLARERWVELTDTKRRLGSASSPPAAVEFMDYGCAYCREFHKNIETLLDSLPGVSIAIRSMKTHPDPKYARAAAAASCAARVGRFEEMHDFFLSDTTWLWESDWSVLAKERGVPDAQVWGECIGSARTADVLARDSAWAERLEIRGTPTLITRDGARHPGVLPLSELKQLILRSGG